MAKLIGVKTLSDREIEYGGERYVMTDVPAQLGDILRLDKDFYTDIEPGSFYQVVNNLGNCVAFYDDDSDVRGLGGGHFPVDYEDFTLFRRVESTQQSPTEIRALIEQKRAEIAELESLITVGVGDYVRVVGETYNGELSEGTIGRVDRTDHSAVPYHVVAVFGDCEDWADTDAVEKLTPADAKAALIAQVEEAFKSEVSA